MGAAYCVFPVSETSFPIILSRVKITEKETLLAGMASVAPVFTFIYFNFIFIIIVFADSLLNVRLSTDTVIAKVMDSNAVRARIFLCIFHLQRSHAIRHYGGLEFSYIVSFMYTDIVYASIYLTFFRQVLSMNIYHSKSKRTDENCTFQRNNRMKSYSATLN